VHRHHVGACELPIDASPSTVAAAMRQTRQRAQCRAGYRKSRKALLPACAGSRTQVSARSVVRVGSAAIRRCARASALRTGSAGAAVLAPVERDRSPEPAVELRAFAISCAPSSASARCQAARSKQRPSLKRHESCRRQRDGESPFDKLRAQSAAAGSGSRSDGSRSGRESSPARERRRARARRLTITSARCT
jgi:hypothetical protein